jgi:hypothetical protein
MREWSEKRISFFSYFFKKERKWENITRATIRPGLASLPLTGIDSAPHTKTAPSQNLLTIRSSRRV